jgi:hypothetical protein
MRYFHFLLFLFTAAIVSAQVMGPKMSISEPIHDFGDIIEGETVVHNYKVINSGGDLLVINSVRASCGCTAAIPEKKELEPGEATEIEVKFNTQGRRGHQKKYVYLFSNDAENPEYRLTFTAHIKENKDPDRFKQSPQLSLSKKQHNFGVVTEGDIVDFEMQLKNSGRSDLVISNIRTSCGCTAALLSSKVIEPDDTATLRIELDTADRSGKMTRSIIIYSNDPQRPQQVVTLYVNIKKRET